MKPALFVIIAVVLVMSIAGCTQLQGTSNQQQNTPPGTTLTTTSAADDVQHYYDLQTSLKYTMTSTEVSQNEVSGTKQTTITEYRDGLDNIRQDRTTATGNQRIYFVDNVFTSCTQKNSAWTCIKTPDSFSQQMKDMIDQLKEYIPDYTVVSIDPRTIAGEQTSCFELTGIAKNLTVDRCFTSDGIAAYMKMDWTIINIHTVRETTATSIVRSVSASDFIPPATPVEIPMPPAR
ncbi:MAG: hypothetical protein HY832_00690 [Candidatus Aenigmarchaeota archaeon]|nr:hypothetical protein [Candidatus Aenigmarchaeota archaeon]